jgi:hypothetical protein
MKNVRHLSMPNGYLTAKKALINNRIQIIYLHNQRTISAQSAHNQRLSSFTILGVLIKYRGKKSQLIF